MITWLKRKIVKWVREDWDDGRYSREDEAKIAVPRIRGANSTMKQSVMEDSYDSPIRFELSPAVGGRILTVRQYDPKHDRHDSTVYVIPTGDDVGARVAKILNLELLK